VRRSRIRETWPLHPADEGLDRDIRKFEQVGTRSAVPYLAIMEALDLHEAIGPARKLARINWLRDRLIGRLEGRPKLTLLASPVPGIQTALLAVQIEGLRAPALTAWLFTKRGLYATTATRDGVDAVRISPNIFTTAAEVDRLGNALIEASASGIDWQARTFHGSRDLVGWVLTFPRDLAGKPVTIPPGPHHMFRQRTARAGRSGMRRRLSRLEEAVPCSRSEGSSCWRLVLVSWPLRRRLARLVDSRNATGRRQR
jgi:hypothetical protein